ncbi:MAG: ATP-binding protein [bacterium]|nr:ATP-binding protein [bacterium]
MISTPIPCWFNEDRCVKGIAEKFLRKAGFCLDCDVFQFAAGSAGKSGQSFLAEQLAKYDETLVKTADETNRKLKAKIDELSIFLDISTAMQSTLDLEEVLYIILTGVTAGFALGFNRSILFLVDDSGKELSGKMGVGPATGEEANRIWTSLTTPQSSFDRIITDDALAQSRKSRLNEFAQQIRVPLTQAGGIIALTALDKKPFLIPDAVADSRVNPQIFNLLGSKSFATAPLLSKQKVIGVLWVDNLYSNEPITEEDLRSLMRFAGQAGLAIENAQLYRRIEHFNEELETEIERATEELRQTEKELAHREKLAALGEMAASVAHEMRNPMTALRGFAQRMHRRMPETDPNRKYTAIIIEEVDRLTRLIRDVLDYARLPEPELQIHNINNLIQGWLDLIKDDLVRYKIELKTSCGDLPVFQFDSEQIKQVFLNVVFNAIHAMQDNGGILTISTAVEDNTAKMVIADTGPGIWPEIIKDIFNPFFTTKAAGTGLGLSIAHRILEDHGGDIKVQSQAGQGATFIVMLPLTKKD